MSVMVYFNSMSAAGGIERVISHHIEFISRSYQVTLVTKDCLPSFFPTPVDVQRESLDVNFIMNMKARWQRIFKIIFTTFSTIVALRRVLKKIKPEIVYVASPLNLLEIFIAGVDCKNILVTEHSSFSAYNWVYKLIIASLYPRVGLLMVPTKTDNNYYISRGIHNEYVPNPLSFYPNVSSDLSSKWALCVGRLTDDKRHDLLLLIWHLSDIHKLGWRLRIVGRGECESDLHKKIHELDLNESVIIEPPTTSILEKYFASSIFLLTSKAEGFGLVLAEAMACGVPCISFDCPSGPRDIIENAHTGYLLNEGDIDGYVKALRELAINSNQRLEFGAKAKFYIKKFQIETVQDEFMRVLRKSFPYTLLDQTNAEAQ